MTNEEKKLEGWNKLLKEKCKIPERFRLIDTEKPKGNPYMKFVLIFLGLLAIAGSLAYNGSQGNYKSDIDCGNANLTCEGDTLNCDCEKCPTNPCTCNCEMPNEIELVIKNETG